MKVFLRVGVPILLIGLLIWDWDGTSPSIEWVDESKTVGLESRIVLRATDSGKGLKGIQVRVKQKDRTEVVFDESFGRSWVPWADSTPERELALIPSSWPSFLEEGAFNLEVSVADHPNWWIFNRETIDSRDMTLDLTPPRMEVLSSQHNIRQGGAEVVVYRVSDDASSSGVLAGGERFSGFRLTSLGDGVMACIFALGYNAGSDTQFMLWSEDRVGNAVERRLPVRLHKRRYRQRRIEISDRFIDGVAPEILSRSGVERPESNGETFTLINAKLRTENHDQLKEINEKSAGQFLWTDPFLQLSNSKVEASFADERTYFYKKEKVDQQTHLGFDLASVARSPVEASNDGIVLFADYLGIYGNCVVVDHGLGLVSLYAHLSRIDVSADDPVRRGQSLGLTGQTGLAAGDHLHFSMFVQGRPVNPLEWWDPKWIRERVKARIEPGAQDE